MPDRHIFLIGMQGCGKSSLGKRVARETGIPFADTDAIVAQSIGGTVNDFFAQYGEEQFRRAETGGSPDPGETDDHFHRREHGHESGEPAYHAQLGADRLD